jgi:hypothetical protein
MSGDARIAAVLVKGDRIVDPSASRRIVTRSQTKAAPERWTEVSALVKMVKLLLAEWSQQEESTERRAGVGRTTMETIDGDDDDDGDYEDEEELDDDADVTGDDDVNL